MQAGPVSALGRKRMRAASAMLPENQCFEKQSLLSGMQKFPSSGDAVAPESSVNEEDQQAARDKIDKKNVPPNLMVRSASVIKFPTPQLKEPLDTTLKEFDFVLKEPIICAGFRKYLQTTFSEENLDFWKLIEHYRDIKDPQKRFNEAQFIYDEYLSLSSEKEVNAPQTFRAALEEKLKSRSEFAPDFFDSLQLEIYYLMKRDSFRNFVHHKSFAECRAIYHKVRRLVESPEDQDQRNGLTDRDWRFLLTGAKEVILEAGTQILTMDATPTSMYRIKSGALRVFKPREDGDEHTICVIDTPGAVVGELSVLGNYGFATASVVCHTNCTLHQMELPFIVKLFEREVDLARRFYLSVGNNLARLLKDISSLTNVAEETPREENSKNGTGDALVQKAESDFHMIFNLDEKELLIQSLKCSYDKVIVRKGTLYVSPTRVYFYSRIFSQKTKERISLHEIESVEVRDRGKLNCCLRLDCGRKKYQFHMKMSEGVALELLLNDLMNVIKNSGQVPVSPRGNSFPVHSEEEKILSDSDWDILLAGGAGSSIKENSQALMTFSKGDVILEEGKNYMMVCQIASGSCRIEKHIPESDMCVELGRMREGEVFGEMNFITGRQASASVIAESRVDMYVIGPSVQSVFTKNPGVVIRFYHYLCMSLARRIILRESEGWGRSYS